MSYQYNPNNLTYERDKDIFDEYGYNIDKLQPVRMLRDGCMYYYDSKSHNIIKYNCINPPHFVRVVSPDEKVYTMIMDIVKKGMY